MKTGLFFSSINLPLLRQGSQVRFTLQRLLQCCQANRSEPELPERRRVNHQGYA
jgi:hypothetical protein